MTQERSGILLCLVGAAGSGKTSIAEALLGSLGSSLRKSCSITTRSMRAGERPGESYKFVSREDFERRRAAGELFEAEEIHGNWYGTPKAPIDAACRGEFDLLLVIDIQGALTFRRAFPANTVFVFIAPPSLNDIVDRMRKRGGISEEELKKRMGTARREYALLQKLIEERRGPEYLVVNDILERAIDELKGIITAERCRTSRLRSPMLEKLYREKEAV